MANLFKFKNAELFHAEIEVVESIQRPANAKSSKNLPPIIEDNESEQDLPPLIQHSKQEGDSLVIYCDNCTQKLEVPNELIGKEIECPVCHHKETVPAESEPAPNGQDPPNP